MLIRLALLLTIAIALPLQVRAEKMDLDTTTLVIEKLEHVLDKEGKKPALRSGVSLRLGDLYAERARLKAIEEVEGSCKEKKEKKCEGADTDRETAIKYYQSAYEGSPKELKGHILLQSAYLHGTLGRIQTSDRLYKQIIREGRRTHSGLILGQAHMYLADSYFARGQFGPAYDHYISAVKIKETPRRGYAHYRSAWCLLNQGKLKSAQNQMARLLQSAELLDLKGEGKIEPAFHEDVSRDYASFIARGKVGAAEIEKLNQLSPERIRLENLLFLAKEAERVGQKHSAILIWDVIFKHKLETIVRMEGHAHLAQVHLDLFNRKKAQEELQNTVNVWRRHGCSDEDRCALLKTQMRKMVVDWNKLEKKDPTAPLLASYQTYLSLFDDDAEMFYWAGQVAAVRKSYKTGISLYHSGSVVAHKQMRDEKAAKSLRNVFEGSLLGEIEMAEATNDPRLRLAAYDHYLNLNASGAKATEVNYQKAHVLYELKRYKDAANLFKYVAQNEKTESGMRIQAADLALDSLVLLKDHESIEKWSLGFARQFPTRKNEYLQIARTAALDQVKEVVDKSQSRSYSSMVAKLKSYNLKNVPQKDQIAFLKNRIALGERMKNLSEVEQAAVELQAVRGLSGDDREWAMAKQLWALEMQMEFGKAFQIAKKMDFPKTPEADKMLKLAVLADLAGHRAATSYYEKFIDKTSSRARANEIRALLIRRSNRPWSEIENEERALSSDPALLADLVLEAYARQPSDKRAKKFLNSSQFRRTDAGRTLSRILARKDFKKFRTQISNHQLKTSSDRLMQATLQKRMQLLGEADGWLAKATDNSDWVMQILSLDIVAKENSRLYQDLLKTPAPRGLNQQQLQEYQNLLKQRAEEFLSRSKLAYEKLGELWRTDGALKTMITNYEKARPELRKLLGRELEDLRTAAPRIASFRIGHTLRKSPEMPKREQIVQARNRLREQPFSMSHLQKLRRLEEKAGGAVMVGYLDVRAAQMKGAGRE